MAKFQHNELYTELWTQGNQPFTSNEKDIYIKLELNEESLAKYKEERGLDSSLTLQDILSGKMVSTPKPGTSGDEESKDEGEALQPIEEPKRMVAYS